MRLLIDIETDSLEIDQVKNIWCIVCKDIDTNEIHTFTNPGLGEFRSLVSRASTIIGHNIIDYDYPVLDAFYRGSIDPTKIIDTLVLSRVLRFRPLDDEGQSLEAWGVRFGSPKHPSPDFTKYSDEMLMYCIQDVEITHQLYDYLRSHLDAPEYHQAVDTEMKFAWICLDMHQNGFKYDKAKADELRLQLDKDLLQLDAEIARAFPPKLCPIREITPRVTKHGTISKANLPRDWTDYSRLHAGCPFTLVEYRQFNPGSTTQLVERLDNAGWAPVVRTKSGNSFKINEENLATLPGDAPQGARLLVERLLVANRVRTLKEWEASYNEKDGRIHGRFISIGTWPGRMSHKSPNMGNVAAKKSIKYKSDRLKHLAIRLGGSMRGLWTCDDDAWLVGTDMEGAHIRLFAHYIDDKEFTKAVISGDKKNGTDVHSLGARTFDYLGCDRDLHKTFIFSFFNGARAPKVAEIFGCSVEDGARALKRYQDRFPGIARLNRELIPKYAAQGWFPAIDGRKIFYDQEHGMFAGMLQSGEAIVMKMANILWRKELRNESKLFKQVNLVHDEFVTEVRGDRESAEVVGRIQGDAIRRVGELLQLKCPLAGESKVGKSWLEVH